MLLIIRQTFSPLFSLFIFTLGSGLFTTLVSLRLHLDGASPLLIGLMAGAYYAGLACGSFRIEPFIARVGHIRAFSVFASALAVVSLLNGIIILPWVWLGFRFIAGFLTAGLFIVIESWLLVMGSASKRGQTLAFYMIALYAAQALGQFFIPLASPETLTLFAVIAMLSSLAVIPLAMTRVDSPKIEAPSTLGFKKLYQAAVSGIVGCFFSGLILGALYGLLPIFIVGQGLNSSDIAFYMATVIFGGMALQYPLGRLSDHVERRYVLIGISVLTVIFSLLIVGGFAHYWLAAVYIFIFGGLVFALYPISISHACDSLQNEDIVAGTQSLLLAYSVGATLGPLLAPLFIHLFGKNGLFFYFIFVAFLLVLFFGWRLTRKPSVTQEESFVSVSQTTPLMAELDPRGENLTSS